MSKELQPERGVAKYRACVVGAGPAGILAAAALAKRQFAVDVFERRDALPNAVTNRNYSMVLSGRGTVAMQELGVLPAVVGPAAQPMLYLCTVGGMRVPVKTSYGITKDEHLLENKLFIVDRHTLTIDLMKEVEAMGFPSDGGAGSIVWHWGYKLDKIDWDSRVAKFQPCGNQGSESSEKSDVEVHYDLLIGADGYESAVRAAIKEKLPYFSIETLYNAPKDVSYKTFGGVDLSPLSNDQVIPGVLSDKPRQTYWMLPGKAYAEGKPRPTVGMWKTEGGHLAGIVSLMPHYEEGFVRAQLQAAVPGLPDEIVDSIVAQLKEGGPQKPNVHRGVLQLSQLHGPNCVLVGDSGHSFTGSLGQGCNAACESVLALMRVIDEQLGSSNSSSSTNGSSSTATTSSSSSSINDSSSSSSSKLDKVPAAYTRRRLPDINGLLMIEWTMLMCTRPKDFPADHFFLVKGARYLVLLSSAASAFAYKWLRGRGYGPRLLMARLRDPHWPYAKIWNEMWDMAKYALAAIVAAAVAALAALVLLIWAVRSWVRVV